jgi:hypothetical protein
MLKRLLIAVFVIGLCVAFSGTAFADTNPDDLQGVELQRGQTHTFDRAMKPTYLTQPADFQRSADDAQGPIYQSLFGSPAASPASPDTTTACPYEQDYTDYAGTEFFYNWTRCGGDPRELAMRFDVQKDHIAEIYGSWYYMFEVEAGAEVQVTVYGDVGFIPDDGDVLFTGTTGPLAEDLDGGYYYFDIEAANGGSPVVLEGYTNYHIAIKSVAAGGECVLFASDDGGDGSATGTLRSSYRYSGDGLWYNAAEYFGDGFDPNFIITSISCEYYSSCGIRTVWSGYGWLYPLPDNAYSDGSTLDGMGQKFIAEGPETVTDVRFYHYDLSGSYGAGAFYPVTGTNGVEIAIWPDDGSGNIDELAGPIATEYIPGGLANLFPATGGDGTANGWNVIVVPIPSRPVVYGPYHITAKLTSADPADGQLIYFYSDNSENPATGGSVHYTAPVGAWENSGLSANWLAEGEGEEVGYYIKPVTCKDEFYTCSAPKLYNVEATHIYGLPINIAAGVAAKPVNRLEKIRWQFFDPSILGEDGGNYEQQVVVWTDGGGFPGAEIYRSSVYTAGDLTGYPGWNEEVIPGGLQILGNFFVGYEDVTTDGVSYFYFAVERGAGEVYGGAKYYSTGSAAWRDLGDAVGESANAMMEVDFCSVPVTEWPCAASTDWATIQGGLNRDGHNGNPFGDPYCDLTLVWSYAHPTNLSLFAGPIIRDGLVVQAFSDEYIVFDLATGAQVDVLGPFGTNISCTPSVFTVDIGGTPTDVLFVGGGSDGMVYAYDWSAIGTTPAPIWSYDPAGSGTIRWGNFMVLNDGTIDVLYFAQDNAKLWAVEAATGVKYTGWAVNPISIPGFGPTTNRNGCSNGVDRVYYAVQDPGFLGDLYSIDAFTGVIDWQLSTAGGLQGGTLWSLAISDEGFDGGISFEAAGGGAPPRLYTVSTVTGNYPVDGVFYSLNADDGSVLVASKCNRVRYGTPIVDALNVVIPTFSRWVQGFGPYDGSMLAFNKETGFIAWENGERDSRIYCEGFMTCEVDRNDWVFSFSEDGYLQCFNSETGEEVFHRRIDYGVDGINVGGPGAVVPGYMAFASYYGGIQVLETAPDPRPRLELLAYRARTAVPFGTNLDTAVVFPDMITNTGCADLEITMTADLESNGASPFTSVAVPSEYTQTAKSIADRLTSFGDNVPAKYSVWSLADDAELPSSRDEITTRRQSVSAATAAPPYLVTSVYYATVAPGDTADITVNVIQDGFTRGQYPFFISFQTNDPDYFLNPGAPDPEISVLLISGCVIDTTTLFFGVGGANEQLVTNTGRLGTGDWGDGPAGFNGFLIDGAGAEYYQGGYVYGVSQKRIAMHTQDWTSGTSPLDGEAASYVSLQPDPNYVSGDCKPALAENIVVNQYSTDGLNYTDLYGSVVYKTFLDSVQLWTDELGNWDWELVYSGTSGAFDNDSTMGLLCNARTVGVLDAPAVENLEYLNQMTIEVFDFQERNGNTVNDWGMAHFVDYDVGNDSVTINRNVSASWTFDQDANEDAWGTIKIPFGPGYTPTKNNIGIVGESGVQGFWEYGTYWDSVYFYINDYGTGAIINTEGGTMQEGDGEAHQSLVAGINFAGNGTYSFAVAQWALHGVPGINSAGSPEVQALAHIANKFVGFGRGDMNNDNVADISDLIRLAQHIFYAAPNAIPFAYLSDVNADGATDISDLNYMVNYYFYGGPAPVGDYEI